MEIDLYLLQVALVHGTPEGYANRGAKERRGAGEGSEGEGRGEGRGQRDRSSPFRVQGIIPLGTREEP